MRCKRCIAFLLILSLVLSNTGFSTSAAAKKVKLSQTKVTIVIGKSKALQLKNATGGIKWSASSKKVSLKPTKNTKKCKVTAKKVGKVTVKAKYKKKVYKCVVTVKKAGSTSSSTTSEPTTSSAQTFRLTPNSPTVTTEATEDDDDEENGEEDEDTDDGDEFIEAPTTEAPTTEAPTTEAPTTEAPTTEAPTTEAPTTEEPTTEAPTTEAPTTEAPTTEAPTTEAPTTEAPTTEAPTTEAPTTEAPHVHSWSSWVTVKDATCTEDGKKEKSCSCGAKETEVISATGHQNTEVKSKRDATCTEAGYSGDIVCSTCGTVINAGITTPALGHDWAANYTVDESATCTVSGSKSQHCTRCDEKKNVTEIPAKGHSQPEIRNAVFATCTRDGYTGDAYCTDCEIMLHAGQVIPALGHSWGEYTPVWSEDGKSCAAVRECLNDTSHKDSVNASMTSEVTIPATCEGVGTTTYTATFADSLLPVQTNEVADIPATGHDWGEVTYTWSDDGKSCTASHTCKTDASHTESEEAVVTSEVTIPATCEDIGTTTYTATFSISEFLTQTKDVQDVEALGHEFSEDYTIDVPATCTEPGSESQHCIRCEETQNSREVPAKAHAETETRNVVAVTCDSDGYTGDVYCVDCGVLLHSGETITALGHSWGEPTYEWSDDGSTCTATRSCANDAEHVETETVSTADEVQEDATCTEQGTTRYTAEFSNVAFSTQIKDIVDVPALGHDYNEVVTEPECLSIGYTTHTCSRCSDSYVTDIVPAIGHNWGEPTYEWEDDGSSCRAIRVCSNDASHTEVEDSSAESIVIQEPTCTDMGTTKYTATFENEVFETQTKEIVDVPANGHAWEEPIYVWSEDGKSCTATRICSTDRNHVEEEEATITSFVRFDATCTEMGATTYSATFENDAFSVQTKLVVDIPARGHDYAEEYTIDVPATCLEEGSKSQHCSRCSSVQNVTVIDALGHDYVATVTEPTCVNIGYTTHTCSRCGDSYIDTIVPATGHDYEENIIEPTCLSIGYTSHNCKNCSDNYISNVIPATGHDWGDPEYEWSDDGKTCTATRVCKNDPRHVETSTITSSVTEEPTCTEMGTTTYAVRFSNTAFSLRTRSVVDIPATGHNWLEPTYTWSEDGKSCVASRTCDNDCEHVETEEANITSEVTVEPTCLTKGTTTYTAEFESDAFETQTKDVVDIPVTGHAYGEPMYNWSADGSSCVATRICSNDPHHVETEAATVTNSVKLPATCTTNGVTLYTARYNNSAFATQTKEIVNIPATGHNWGTPTYTWSADGKTCIAKRVCKNDSIHVESESGTVTSVVKTAATCLTKGTTTYTAKFSNTVFSTQTKDVVDIPDKGHNWGTPIYTWSADGKSCTAKRVCKNDSSHTETQSGTVTSAIKTAATCTTKGTTTYIAKFSNTAFNAQTKDVQDISATGHTWGTPTYTWSSDGKTCTAKRVCTKDSSHVETEAATVTSAVKTAATCTTKGTTTYTAKFSNTAFSTQTKDVQDIPAKRHNWGTPTYTWSADGKTCIAKRVCKNDSIHVETELGTVTSKVKTASTCTTKGTTTYTATFTNTAFTTQTKDVQDINATGHTWGTPTYTWSSDGKTCTAKRVCSKNSSHTETQSGTVTSKVKTAATCTTKGTTTYTAKFSNTAFSTQTKDVVDISAKGHTIKNDYCTVCNTKIAGLYDKYGNLLCTWDKSGINVKTNYTSKTYKTSTTSPYYVITNNYPRTTKVVIPDDVTFIGERAFQGCIDLRSVTIPDSVVYIGTRAFAKSGLTSITIPNSVASIGASAFYSCSGLTSIKISASVTSIGDGMFQNCTGLTHITIPDSVKSIGEDAFFGCSGLTSIAIPSSVTSIGTRAFASCSGLTRITIPNSVTSIGDRAFYNCKGLTSISIPSSVTSIEDYTFWDCSGLTSITIPDGVTSIRKSAFEGCSELTSITIPNSVIYIGDSAFDNCRGLTSITIPSSVEHIGECTFIGCSGLTSVTFKNTTGWHVVDNTGGGSRAVSSSDLANTSIAATYLTSTYIRKYWSRVG